MKKRGKFHMLKLNGVDEYRQGLIFYICRCYNDLPKHKRDLIDELYRTVGGENADALRSLMLTDESFAKICLDHYIGSETTLKRLRLRFYREFPLEEMLK